MVAESKFTEKEGESKRAETLSLGLIDTEYLERRIRDDLGDFKDTHEEFFEQRAEWILGMRDLQYKYKEGYFEDASDLHIPYSLIMHKAMHAKIFQVFSQQNFFSVEANNNVFEESEELIKFFMNWTLTKWMNRGLGKSDVMDDWISDILEEGSGILKLWWDEWEHNFLDLDITTEEETPDVNIFAGLEGVDVEETPKTKTTVKNVKKTLRQSGPASATVKIDDFFMPPGQSNVQSSPWVAHRVRLLDEDLKLRAKQNKFDKDVVEEALDRRMSNSERHSDDTYHTTRRDTRRMEGINDDQDRKRGNESQVHVIYEWYGKVYISKDNEDDDNKDVKKFPEEVVIWYHEGIRKILGWTYLHRISPSGRRPFYKADFMPSKERAFGIGVGELLFSLNNHIDAVHNLKLDNGILSSMQFGVYRSGSAFKPDTFKIRPGELIPVEDTNDIKFQNIPYLGQFGENEELVLTGYGEKLLAVNDINLGNLTGKGVAGALRNATGAQFVDRQANIQLHPHLDRIARELKLFLSDMFIMTRSRMKPELFFRVTGEDGKGFFGEVSKEDLRGDFDFVIDVELAAASESEKQQRASLMLQTLLNPTFMETGIIQPGNLFELLKEFLIRHQIRDPDKFITRPPEYVGPPMSPEQRVMAIMLNRFDEPPIENSVKPEENHERALEVYQEFEDSELFGTLSQEQVEAFSELKQATIKFQGLLSGGAKGVPNIAGTQFAGTGGLPALGPGSEGPDGAEGGPLGSPEGEVNGPVQ